MIKPTTKRMIITASISAAAIFLYVRLGRPMRILNPSPQLPQLIESQLKHNPNNHPVQMSSYKIHSPLKQNTIVGSIPTATEFSKALFTSYPIKPEDYALRIAHALRLATQNTQGRAQ